MPEPAPPHEPIQASLPVVWCQKCYFYWTGEGPNFAEAVARRHARDNPGHPVDLRTQFLVLAQKE